MTHLKFQISLITVALATTALADAAAISTSQVRSYQGCFCGSWGRYRHSVGRRGQDCSADAYRAEKIGRLSYNLCYRYRYTAEGIQLAFHYPPP